MELSSYRTSGAKIFVKFVDSWINSYPAAFPMNATAEMCNEAYRRNLVNLVLDL